MHLVRATDENYQLTRISWREASLALRGVVLCRVGSIGEIASKKASFKSCRVLMPLSKGVTKGFA